MGSKKSLAEKTVTNLFVHYSIDDLLDALSECMQALEDSQDDYVLEVMKREKEGIIRLLDKRNGKTANKVTSKNHSFDL